jgi:Zn-dependent alcohol dehydrogenase
MRVAGITARGEPVEILEVDELAPPAADEVLLDVAAAGIGNWDELVRIGSWQIGGPAPIALGTEATGTVVARRARCDVLIAHPGSDY